MTQLNLFVNLMPRELVDLNYIIPTDPAVKPTARKKTNSNKSLGREFTIRFK